jgi:glycosyltransferase involved in cell wall biosynthesis
MPRRVSIIIPCHNAEPWLAQALESALAQTWPEIEVIVIDDGSRDGSAAVALRYASRGVRVAAQPNLGASAARNHGLRLAGGDFIQFLDADDLLAPEKIARQMGAAAALPGAAHCGTWSRFRLSPADADFTPQMLCRDAEPVEWVAAKLGHNAMMHPASWLVSRALADRAGPWDESLSLDDDGEYFTRIVLSSEGVRCSSDAVSYYRSGLRESLSGSKSDRAWESAFRSLELSATRLLAAEDSARTRRACATAYQQFIYDSYPGAAACRGKASARVALLGGSDLRPAGGARFRLARRLIGWRLAKRLSSLFR